jgi:diguanylate cyclase (GGDEF)-like protein
VPTTAIDPRVRVRKLLPPAGQLLLFGTIVTALGWIGLLIRPSDGSTALWWPGAGVAVAGLLLLPRRLRSRAIAVLVLGGAVSGLSGGRTATVAVLLATINAAGAVVVILVLSWRRADPRAFHTLEDLTRVLLATLAGALTAGSTAGVVAAAALEAGFVTSFVAVTASHAAAVLLVLPFVLRAGTAPVEAGRVESVAQWCATVVMIAVVVSPRNQLPLAFLLLAVLLWPALRSSLRTTAAHLLAVGLVASLVTIRGGGPFPSATSAVGRSDRVTVALVQLLVIVTATVMLAVLVTVAQRRSLLRDISRREELFRVGFNESLLGLLLLRPQADGLRIVELNGVAARLLGGRAVELLGTRWCDPFAAEDRERMRAAVASLSTADSSGWHGEIHLVSPTVDRWIEIAMSPAVEGTTAGELLTVQMVDVTARRVFEARLSDLALRDGLTGLANRVLLGDRLEQALADADRDGLRVGVMFLDLDRFKLLNDTHGHAAGDAALVEVGKRLERSVRSSDTVARIGGDEFVVVCPKLADEASLAELHLRVEAALLGPVVVDDAVWSLAASIGVAMSTPGTSPRELLHRADADMYAHKGRGRPAPTSSVVADADRVIPSVAG